MQELALTGGVALGEVTKTALGAPKVDWTGCEVVRSYEDNSHLIFCGDEPEAPEPDLWEQLDILREVEGVEVA